MKYIMAEVFSGKLMELEEDKYTERREKVYTFMKIPREFEKVLSRCLLFVHRPFYKWLPIINCFVSIKISLTNVKKKSAIKPFNDKSVNSDFQTDKTANCS